MRKLTDQELDEISDVAIEAAENFIFTRVSKKEILDLHINADITYENELNIDISVDLDLDELSQADVKEIVEGAVDAALEKLDKYIDDNYF